jgi:hypothetical protein
LYILACAYKNARLNGDGGFLLNQGEQCVAKWTVLDAGVRNRELLQLIIASFCGALLLDRLPVAVSGLCGTESGSFLAANLRVLHEGIDTAFGQGVEATGGIRITADRQARPLSRSKGEVFFPGAVMRNTHSRPSPQRDFLLAYGEAVDARRVDADLDFSDPFLHIRRFHSLFRAEASTTDPVALLDQLFYRGSRKKRLPPLHVLSRLCTLLDRHFAIAVDHWPHDPADAAQEWNSLPPVLQRPLLPLLDAVRHTLDAFPKKRAPLDLPGVILLDRPDRYCGYGVLTPWLELFNALFPNMQFFITLPEDQRHLVPERILAQRLSLPVPLKKVPKHSIRAPKVDVLLIDIDGRLPNLSLMKLSRYFKERGREVTLGRGACLVSDVVEVYASSVFSSARSSQKVSSLKAFYGDSLHLGGSGIDPRKRLPSEIESLPADYDLYPELGDRALGFLSRGCPMNCPFCIVPVKEGLPRQVSDLDSLLERGRLKKLILLDDNLLSLPEAEQILDEMVSREIMVNFTQTLDLRFLNRGKAALLRRLDCSNTRFTRSNYYFSLNDTTNLSLVRDKYELFGFSRRENVEFVCMYGFNTSLADDVERFRFIRTLPGAYVFVQRYQPVPGGQAPDMARFFEGNTDRLIGELISIEYTQNMKSMEKYYRWVSRFYAETFGKLHMPLVDTIFRYNRRHDKWRYIQTLAGITGQRRQSLFPSSFPSCEVRF